ncbi:hypothetical protein JMJ99_03405 [Companilactobacillus zhachilii]|uniref:hypothetical protein n=1 Tax=Companilactobacillus zhachilii TaxID=2304606 RepID=UPI00192074E7|nr:hypothetical protein [Companilactobacillus zhachilii]MBL3530403.1 hypothetical protein [Companilactobacillus zhachilii]
MKTVKSLIVGMALLASSTGAMILSQKDADAAKVASVDNNVARLYREDGKLITDRALGPNSNWLVGRIFTHNNETYYQVATKEYLKANDSKRLYDNTNPSLNYTPNIQRINQYFIKYLNALHAANGTPMTTTTPEMFEYANHRAYQQVGSNLNHSTRPRNTQDNLYGMGYDFILKYGTYNNFKSDRDVAFYLLKGWYDDDNNIAYGPGQAGHFGHRAALIYTGNPVALGMSDNATAMSAEWPEDLDGFNSIFNYTGSNPNTNFISKDAVPE